MKKIALGMILLVGGAVAWRMVRSDAADPKMVFDRFWVDHQPQGVEDKFQVFFMNSEFPFGRFVTRTAFLGQFEEFHYHVIPKEDGVMDFLFGATREIQRVKYTARPCHEHGFDYCLDLAGTSRGVKRYYSKKEWGPTHSEEEAVERFVQHQH
jgi:hypothetical protein